MTIEEAIKHAEDISASCIEGCSCREEHHQLAEWLKELIQLREEVALLRKDPKNARIIFETTPDNRCRILVQEAESKELTNYTKWIAGSFARMVKKLSEIVGVEDDEGVAETKFDDVFPKEKIDESDK